MTKFFSLYKNKLTGLWSLPKVEYQLCYNQNTEIWSPPPHPSKKKPREKSEERVRERERERERERAKLLINSKNGERSTEMGSGHIKVGPISQWLLLCPLSSPSTSTLLCYKVFASLFSPLLSVCFLGKLKEN